MLQSTYVLFESASGYGLFEVVEAEETAALHEQVQRSVTELDRFSKIVKLKAFQVGGHGARGGGGSRLIRRAGGPQPFKSAADALQNINHISEGASARDARPLRGP